MTQVNKKTRENKERLFENIRECIPQYQYCFVFGVDNMRNTYLKDVRQELSDSRYVLFLFIPRITIYLNEKKGTIILIFISSNQSLLW